MRALDDVLHERLLGGVLDRGHGAEGSEPPASVDARRRATICLPWTARCAESSWSPRRRSPTRISPARSSSSPSTTTTARWASSSTGPRRPTSTRSRRSSRSSPTASRSSSAARCSRRRSSSSQSSTSPTAAAWIVAEDVGFVGSDTDSDRLEQRRPPRPRLRRLLGLGRGAARGGARRGSVDRRAAASGRVLPRRPRVALAEGAESQGGSVRADRPDARRSLDELIGTLVPDKPANGRNGGKRR